MGAETVKEARCDEVISDTIITERRIEARAKEGGRFSFKIMNLGPGTAKIWIDSDNREAISSYLWDAMGGPLSEFLGRTKGEDQYFLNKFYTKTVVDVGESIRETKGSVIRDKGFSLLGEKDRGAVLSEISGLKDGDWRSGDELFGAILDAVSPKFSIDLEDISIVMDYTPAQKAAVRLLLTKVADELKEKTESEGKK